MVVMCLVLDRSPHTSWTADSISRFALRLYTQRPVLRNRSVTTRFARRHATSASIVGWLSPVKERRASWESAAARVANWFGGGRGGGGKMSE